MCGILNRGVANSFWNHVIRISSGQMYFQDIYSNLWKVKVFSGNIYSLKSNTYFWGTFLLVQDGFWYLIVTRHKLTVLFQQLIFLLFGTSTWLPQCKEPKLICIGSAWSCKWFYPNSTYKWCTLNIKSVCLNHAGVTTMKRPDQSHPHPKLEVPRLTCLGWVSTWASAVGGEHSRKEPFEQLIMLLFGTPTWLPHCKACWIIRISMPFLIPE